MSFPAFDNRNRKDCFPKKVKATAVRSSCSGHHLSLTRTLPIGYSFVFFVRPYNPLSSSTLFLMALRIDQIRIMHNSTGRIVLKASQKLWEGYVGQIGKYFPGN